MMLNRQLGRNTKMVANPPSAHLGNPGKSYEILGNPNKVLNNANNVLGNPSEILGNPREILIT